MTVPIDHARKRLTTALIPPALSVALLWVVFIADHFLNLRLYRFGVLPRNVAGLWGILFSPFIHGSWDHLIANSAPILILGWILVYFYPKASWRVVVACWGLGGLWVWSTARENYHIGASGVIYGLAAFLFFSGLIRRRVSLMGVSLIIVFLYGSWVWGVLPLEPEKSWESHLFGAFAGAIMAWFYRRTPTAHVPPPLVLEDGDEPEEQPYLVYEPIIDERDPANTPREPIRFDPKNTDSTLPRF